MQHDFYLKNLEKAAEPMRTRQYRNGDDSDLKPQLRAMMVILAVVVIGAFQPWIELL
jgi:hypothetical protein